MSIEAVPYSSFPSLRATLIRSLASTVLTTFLGLLSSVVLARGLMPEGRGQLALLFASQLLVQPIVSIFTGGSDILFGENPRAVWALVLRIVQINTSFAILIALVVSLSQSAAVLMIGERNVQLGMLYALVVALQCTETDLRSILAAQQLFRTIYTGDAVVSIGYAMACTALLLGDSMSVIGAFGLFGACRAALVFIYLRSLASATTYVKIVDGVGVVSWRRTVLLGSKAFLASLPVLFLMRVDVLLLSSLSTLVEVGIYAIASGIAAQSSRLGSILGGILKGKAILEVDMGRRAVRSIWLVFAIGMLCAVVVLFFGRVLLMLFYGEAYSRSYIPMLVLTVGSVFWASGNVVAGLVCAKRQYPLSASVQLYVALAINVALNVMLIQPYGAIGAAVASLVGCVGYGYVWVRQLLSIYGYRWRTLIPF